MDDFQKIRAKVNSMVRSTGLSGVTLSGKTRSQHYIRYADKNAYYKKALELLTIQIWKFTKKNKSAQMNELLKLKRTTSDSDVKTNAIILLQRETFCAI